MSLPPLDDLAHLPAPDQEMSWRSLNRFGKNDRGERFYLTCLQYAQVLWRQSLPARAILCLDRAWGADLRGDETVLQDWPLPYAALTEILLRAPKHVFLGNPRVHFQHYADRLGPPRQDQRKWRSWACWALTRAARPDLPGDPRHAVEEPTLKQIKEQLARHGIDNETEVWKAAFPKAES